MGQFEVEGTKRHRHPASCRGLEAEASWVDQRNDGHGHSAVGQIDAADASIELDEDAQEVLVGDTLGVGSCLHSRHHELVLWGELLDLTLLLFLSSHFILDLGQIERHLGGPVGVASFRPVDSLIYESMSMDVTVVTASDSQDLLDVEADSMGIQLAFPVVYSHGT